MAVDPTMNPVLDEQWLKRASWWVKHRHQLWLLFVGLLAAADGVAIVYSIYPWVDYAWLGREREAALHRALSTFPNMTDVHAAFAPTPLLVAAPVVLPASSGNNGFDVLVKFVNQNDEWAANVTYAFSTGEGEKVQQTYILNDEERFVIGVGAASSAGAAPAITLQKVEWHRIREPEKFNATKPQFTVSDVVFTPASQLSQTSRNAVSQIKFTVTNESSLSFWSVGFTVVLLRADRPIAARYVTTEQMRSGEQREVSVNLFSAIADAGTVLVVPDVNILDPRSIMPTPGGSIDF